MSGKISSTLRKKLEAEARKRGLVIPGQIESASEIPEEQRVTIADLKIRTKDRRMVTFTPNHVQTLYLDSLAGYNPNFDWKIGKYELRGIREDCLKSRQQGMSTMWLALYFLDTINTPLTQTIILAHDTETTEKLFKIIHRFWEELPPEKRRAKKYSTKREIEFHDIDSAIYVGTAGGEGVGRGGTVNNVHMSERAFWRNGDDVETGLLESVPMDGNVTRESTANGLNDYYDERQRAHNGESAFIPRFFGWNLTPEYREPVLPNFRLTEEEMKLVDVYGLDNEQLQWRRTKIKTLKDKFVQEYPLNEKQSFLTSGNPYFERENLDNLNDQLQSEEFNPLPAELVKAGITLAADSDKLKRLLNEEVAGLKRLKRELWTSLNERGLKIFQMPEVGRFYVLGADTAEGIDDRGNHDFDAAAVYDAQTWEQVAALHGRWDTHEYGLILAELGFFYNIALLIPERNNHGHAVINAAMHTGGYPEAKATSIHGPRRGMYMHQEYDEKKKPTNRRPGWPTTSKSKYFALDALATGLTDHDIHPRDRAAVGEMLTFIKKAGGKAGGEGKAHDDHVLAHALCAVGLQMKHAEPKPQKTVGSFSFGSWG